MLLDLGTTHVIKDYYKILLQRARRNKAGGLQVLSTGSSFYYSSSTDLPVCDTICWLVRIVLHCLRPYLLINHMMYSVHTSRSGSKCQLVQRKHSKWNKAPLPSPDTRPVISNDTGLE